MPGERIDRVGGIDVKAHEIDFHSAAFLADPYPYYDIMRAAAPILYREDWRLFFLSKYEDVDALYQMLTAPTKASV